MLGGDEIRRVFSACAAQPGLGTWPLRMSRLMICEGSRWGRTPGRAGAGAASGDGGAGTERHPGSRAEVLLSGGGWGLGGGPQEASGVGACCIGSLRGAGRKHS